MLENVLPSSHRSLALGKYLTSLSKHLQPEEAKGSISVKSVTSPVRKRLHIIYLVHDILHHVKYHVPTSSLLDSITSLHTHLQDLFHHAGSTHSSRVKARLQEIVDIWEEDHLIPTTTLGILQDVVAGTNAQKSAQEHQNDHARTAKELAFVLPAFHGDPSMPYYDLPAGNFMPHIVPNSSTPMRPDRIKALQLAAGPADESLVNAFRDFMKDVDALHNIRSSYDDEAIVSSMDELGQVSYRDELGELKGDTYYGWSRAFCEKMKRRDDNELESGRPKVRRWSRSSSASPRKRRRLSDSISVHSSSYSRSRSQSRDGDRHGPSASRGFSHRSRSRSRSPAWGDSFVPPQKWDSTMHTAPIPSQGRQFANSTPNTHLNASLSAFVPTTGSTLFPPPQLGPAGLPVPPPRPPNWTGPWPPPPPPLPTHRLPFPIPPSTFRFPQMTQENDVGQQILNQPFSGNSQERG